LSHYPPIELRRFGTYHDQMDVRTCLELWKTSYINKAKLAFAEEDHELTKAYEFWIRKFRFIEFYNL